MGPPAPAFDVVTINLWGDNGPVKARMDNLAAWLRAEGPTVVLLQEVEHVGGRDQPELLAAAAGYQHVDVIRTGRWLAGGEGLAVLSRWRLDPLPPVELPLAALDHPRGLQQVDVASPVGDVRLGNTHLAWRLRAAPARLRQVRTILGALPIGQRPVIVGGDLNDVPGSPALSAFGEAGFVDCCTHVTRPRNSFDPANPFLWQRQLADRRVDHLLAHGLEMVDPRVVLDGAAGPVVSDHYGIRASLRPLGPPQG